MDPTIDRTKILGPGRTVPIGVGLLAGLPVFAGLLAGAIAEVWTSLLVLLAIAIPVWWRWSQVGVWSDGDHLDVINFTSNHRIPAKGVRLSTETGSHQSIWTELDPGFAASERRLYLHPADNSPAVSVSAVRVMSERQFHAALLHVSNALH